MDIITMTDKEKFRLHKQEISKLLIVYREEVTAEATVEATVGVPEEDMERNRTGK